jgi:CDGSH-type Zn-finger protein
MQAGRPYIVKHLENLRRSNGDSIAGAATIALCRCGGSGNKPFCDGTHWSIDFRDEKN